ncbi:MAG: hypothetical protein EB060_01830 [Proteobacteria bacterium]|nr:hypothetical protein [Pseudomonadota bacterium]
MFKKNPYVRAGLMTFAVALVIGWLLLYFWPDILQLDKKHKISDWFIVLGFLGIAAYLMKNEIWAGLSLIGVPTLYLIKWVGKHEWLKPYIRAAGSFFLGFVVIGMPLQHNWSEIRQWVGVPSPEVFLFSSYVTFVGLFGSIGLLVTGIVPAQNKIRSGLYLLGVLGFAVNLLKQENPGNVALEAALMTTTTWAFFRQKHEPIKTNLRAVVIAIVWMTVALAVGLFAVYNWPVGETTERPGDHWKYIALTGGGLIAVAIYMLDNGVFHKRWGKAPGFMIIYGLGNAFLSFSYLGKFSEVGLLLNVSLAFLQLVKPLLEYIWECMNQKTYGPHIL